MRPSLTRANDFATKYLPIALLLAGLALTVWGLNQIGWPLQLAGRKLQVLRNPTGYGLWIWLFAITALLVFVAKLKPLRATALLVSGFALLAGQFWALLTVLWFGAASAVVGDWLLGRVARLRPPSDLSSGVTRDFPAWAALLAGAGVLGTVAGLCAHYPINYAASYGVALALPLLLGWRRLKTWAEALGNNFNVAADQDAGTRWIQCAVAAAALVHVATAFLPELGFDALAMHLFVAESMRVRHQWGFDVQNYVFAVLPFLVDWTYAIVNMLAGESAARLLNVAFVLGLACMLRELVLWVGGSPRGARWAVLLFLTTPLTFTESSALFIDAGWSAFVVGGTLAMIRVLDKSDDAHAGLPLAGLLWGFALASKSVTMVVLPALLLVMLTRPATWLAPGNRKPLAKALLLGVVAGSVPYVTAWAITRNPVFPFFNALFKSPFFAPINFEPPPFERYLSWDSIYRITFESPRYLEGYPGAAGFQWLLLLVPCALVLLAAPQRRWWVGALLVLGVGGVAGVFQQTAYLRYIFPCVVVLMAAIGAGIEKLAGSGPAGRRIWPLAACCAVALNIIYFHTGSPYADFPLKAAVLDEHKSVLIAERQPSRGIVTALNAVNTGASPVVWLAEPLASGVAADVLYPSWYNMRFLQELEAAKSQEQLLALMYRNGSEFAVIDLQRFSRPELLELTDPVAQSGTVLLRRLKPSLLFAKELLAGPDFSELTAWTLVPGARFDASERAMVVTPQAGAFQKVPVAAHRKYLNTISAKCKDAGAQGRLQVNWIRSSGQAISADSLPYPCKPDWTTHSLEVSAPKGAAFALVYTTSHYGGAVMVKSNSFKGSP